MTPQAQNILDKYSDYFESSTFIGDILRWLGWKICIGLKVFCDLIQKLFDAAYELVAFANDEIFKTFLGNFYSLALAILVISFIILGLTYMFSDKRPDIIKNMLIGMAVIFIGPQITGLLNNALIMGKNAMVSDTSVSSQAISSNVKDLKYIASNKFNFNLNVSESTSKNLMYISMDEHVKPDSVSGDLQKNVFSYVKQISDTGSLEYKEVGKKGMFDIFDPPYYYRYSYHFLQIVLVLLANIIILAFSAYSVVRMIWEILTTRILASIFSMEITSGQKLKKCIESFFHSYLVLFLIAVYIKLFQLAQQFVNNKFPNWDQGLIRSILIIFIALVVIDGPRFIEQLLGYDLGISHGAQKLFGLMRIVQQAQMQRKLSSNAKSQQNSKDSQAQKDSAKMESKSTSGASKVNEPNIKKENSNNSIKEPSTSNMSDSSSNMSGSSSNMSSSSGIAEPNGVNNQEENNNFASGNQNTNNKGNDSNLASATNTKNSSNSNLSVGKSENISSNVFSGKGATPNKNETVNNGKNNEPGKGSSNTNSNDLKGSSGIDSNGSKGSSDNKIVDQQSKSKSEPKNIDNNKQPSTDNSKNMNTTSKNVQKQMDVSKSSTKESSKESNVSNSQNVGSNSTNNTSVSQPGMANKQWSTRSIKSRNKEDKK